MPNDEEEEPSIKMTVPSGKGFGYIGKYSYGKLTGFEFIPYISMDDDGENRLLDSDCICVYPINTKGATGSCRIDIPCNQIDEFIAKLQEAKERAVKS